MRATKDTTRIRSLLLRWYRKHARAFPWREASAGAYLILVSEIMLQQTQAPRVAELLPAFLDRFPSVHHLAQATNAEVIRAWKGLGYNNRALRLRDAARAIVADHGGSIPRDPELLITLPGIGPYAAASIAAFAFDVPTVVVDVNVRRVYSRLASPQPLTTDLLPDDMVRQFGSHMLPRRTPPSEWYNAVMELGATVCMARRTACEACPLSSVCPSAHTITVPTGRTSATSRGRTPEPMFRGEPRRLWRGRIVAALHQHPEGRTRSAVIREVFTSLEPMDVSFVDDLLDRLIKDGLLQRIGQRYRLHE